MYGIINKTNGQNVKSTMIDTLLSYIAPYHCSGCGQTGTLLCDNCKYNINFDEFFSCLNCNMPANSNGVCRTCKLPYSKAWCVGERTDVLEALINGYKFDRVKATYRVLGDLLLEKVDHLPKETIIVPIPTIGTHIRTRGYDHSLLIAQHFARKRGLVCRQLIQRATATKQKGASKSVREAQARQAFIVKPQLAPDVPYLLIDDVVTTGATVTYAAKGLRDAGAEHVWVAAIARQPLD